jgi:hydroxymethylbilane synthase
VKLRIGSRGSRLALWQAEHVRSLLLNRRLADDVEVAVVKTTGDQVTSVPLSEIGSQGLFTKELDRAVLDESVDIAVHSFKDLPTRTAAGLQISAVLERLDERDALVVAPGRPKTLHTLPAGARVGTSSLRRRAQLLAHRPDLVAVDLRGNVDTRLARIAAGDFDAALLALAGLLRLEQGDRAAHVFDPADWLPAPAQGALCIVTRADDAHTRSIVEQLNHEPTRLTTTAERAFLAALEGGCQVPIGAWAHGSDQLTLHGLISSLDGEQSVRAALSGPASRAEQLGEALAQDLLDHGGEEILARVRASTPSAPAEP